MADMENLKMTTSFSLPLKVAIREKDDGEKEVYVCDSLGDFLFCFPDDVCSHSVVQAVNQHDSLVEELESVKSENEKLKKQLLKTHDLFAETHNQHVSYHPTNSRIIKEHLAGVLELLDVKLEP